MSIDLCEIEFAGDQEQDGTHSGEADIAASLPFCSLKQAVDGFDEAICLARLRPGDYAVEMVTNHAGDFLHGFNLGSKHIGAPLRQHGGDDMNLLALKDV